jgi:hypothetical protein
MKKPNRLQPIRLCEELFTPHSQVGIYTMRTKTQAPKLRARRNSTKIAKKAAKVAAPAQAPSPTAKAEIVDDGTPGVFITREQVESWPKLRLRIHHDDGRTRMEDIFDPRVSFARSYLADHLEPGDRIELLPAPTGATTDFIPATPLCQVFVTGKNGVQSTADAPQTLANAATYIGTFVRFGGTAYARRVVSMKLSAENVTVAELLAAKQENDRLLYSILKGRDRKDQEKRDVETAEAISRRVVAPDNPHLPQPTTLAPAIDGTAGPTLTGFAQVVAHRKDGSSFIVSACVSADSAQRIAALCNAADDGSRATVHELTLPNFAAEEFSRKQNGGAQ